MKFLVKIIVLLFFALLLSGILLPFVEQFVNLSGLIVSDMRFLNKYGSDRIFSRLLMVFSFMGFLVFKKELGFKNFSLLGFSDKKKALHLFSGFMLGVWAVALLMNILIFLGHYKVDVDVFGMRMMLILVKSFFAAFLVAFLEETVFRGIIMQTLADKKPFAFALVVSSFLYAGVHFLKPSGNEVVMTSGFYGIDILRDVVNGFWSNKDFYMMPFTGLFILSVLFSYCYVRTSSLYLSVGLHAGLVFGIKVDSCFADNTPKVVSELLYDKSYAVSGLMSWSVLLFMFFLIGFFTREKKIKEEV